MVIQWLERSLYSHASVQFCGAANGVYHAGPDVTVNHGGTAQLQMLRSGATCPVDRCGHLNCLQRCASVHLSG